MTAKIAIVYHSGFGHTEVIANALKRGAEKAGGEVALIKIPSNGEIRNEEWDYLHNAHAIIFGSPTYMGSASGPFKIFQDATSKPWMELKWKNKLAGGFTNSLGFSGDKLHTILQFVILAGQHGMIWVSLGLPGIAAESRDKYHYSRPEEMNRIGSYLGVMSQSENDSPEISPPGGDIRTAEHYGARMVDAARRWFEI